MKPWKKFKETAFLRTFGLLKIPLIAFVRPSIVDLDAEKVVIKIPLNRLTRNHLKSMYFGTLAIGADCAGGYLAARKIFRDKLPVSFVFKDFKAEFFKRPDGHVYFTCLDGVKIAQALTKALSSGERENITVLITATVPSNSPVEPVALFYLTLSLKKKT